MEFGPVGMIIPNIWKNKKMFQTTNQLLMISSSSVCFGIMLCFGVSHHPTLDV
jgi:hypothetical protein